MLDFDMIQYFRNRLNNSAPDIDCPARSESYDRLIIAVAVFNGSCCVSINDYHFLPLGYGPSVRARKVTAGCALRLLRPVLLLRSFSNCTTFPRVECKFALVF